MNAMACVPCIFSLLGSASFFPVASKERNSEHILDLLSIPSICVTFTNLVPAKWPECIVSNEQLHSMYDVWKSYRELTRPHCYWLIGARGSFENLQSILVNSDIHGSHVPQLMAVHSCITWEPKPGSAWRRSNWRLLWAVLHVGMRDSTCFQPWSKMRTYVYIYIFI